MSLKTRLAFKLINAGISLLPNGYRTRTFINDCMLTKKIDVIRDNQDESLKAIRDDLLAINRLEDEALKKSAPPQSPKMPTPPPNRVYKETFFGGLIETEESKQATKQWRENLKC